MQPKWVLTAVISAAILITACAFVSYTYGDDDDPERIGIIGAMEPEVASIKDAMEIERTEEVAGMSFTVGTLHGKDVVVVQCGMGKVNAGVCAQTLITYFNAKWVINTGVAGSLSNTLDLGDFVVSTDAVQHDFDVSPIGYQKGEIPYTGIYAFEADPELRAKAVNAVSECTESAVFEGRVCTGDQFVNTPEQKERITAGFGGLCCEMEGGAIAHICHVNEVPFVIIRTVSDSADSSYVDFEEFSREAAEHCASVIMYMVDHFDDKVSA